MKSKIVLLVVALMSLFISCGTEEEENEECIGYAMTIIDNLDFLYEEEIASTQNSDPVALCQERKAIAESYLIRFKAERVENKDYAAQGCSVSDIDAINTQVENYISQFEWLVDVKYGDCS